LGVRERARNAIIPSLYEMYSAYLNESVIDMIANQYDYEMEKCLEALESMIPSNINEENKNNQNNKTTSNNQIKTETVIQIENKNNQIQTNNNNQTKVTVNNNSNVASNSNSNSNSTSSTSSTKRSGILFLSPRPLSDLAIVQPPSVWQQPKIPSKNNINNQSNSSNSILTNELDSITTTSAINNTDTIDSDDNDSDVNELPISPSIYTATGFESPIYYSLQPSLLKNISKPIRIPNLSSSSASNSISDPESFSSNHPEQQIQHQTTTIENYNKNGEEINISLDSPAHPNHSLHSLYLQLTYNSDSSSSSTNLPINTRTQLFTSAPSFDPIIDSSLQHEGQEEAEELTPAQALTFQRQQYESALKQKKQMNSWMKQHENEKRQLLKNETNQNQNNNIDSNSSNDSSSLFDTSSSSLLTELVPSDLPSLTPLSRHESRTSYQQIESNPNSLIELLNNLFGNEIDFTVIQVIVESKLHSIKQKINNNNNNKNNNNLNEEDYTPDVAQECCETLLEMLNENEMNQNTNQTIQQETENIQSNNKKPFKSNSNDHTSNSTTPSLVGTPFIPSSHQLTDSEIAYRMSIDPSFDPNNYTDESGSALNPNIGLNSSIQPVVELQRNKKGHLILPRTSPNSWAARTIQSTQLTPDLSSQWKLVALQKAFPMVEQTIIEQTFQMNSYQFEQTKSHLLLLFPNTIVESNIQPQPVEQPWSRGKKHHSKVSSTSTDDAEKGISKINQLQDQTNNKQINKGKIQLTEQQFEQALGSVLDNHSSSSSSSSNASSSSSSSSSASSLRVSSTVHSKRRAAFFQASINAFTRGKSSESFDLAARGKAESEAMQSTQTEAALQEFINTNQYHDCRYTIDLHGLRVDEAISILQFVLNRRNRRSNSIVSNELQVITGIGHGSAGGIQRAKLTPAIAEWLRQAGYKISTAKEGYIKGNKKTYKQSEKQIQTHNSTITYINSHIHLLFQ
jgi:hypothetical protein